MKAIRNYQFRNWAGNESCTPSLFWYPETEQDIQEIVRDARAAGKRLRVVGAGHSWSAVACSNDYLVSLDLYNKTVCVDKERKRIRVQAGIRLRELNHVLEESGMALVQLGSISEQSIAGATATGTHGSGIDFQILSSAIVAMRIVDGAGNALEVEEGDRRLDAFRVSLGVLGIVTEITLQCTAAFSLCENSSPMDFDEALSRLPELLQQNEHVKFWWFPHVEKLMCYRYQRTQGKPQLRNCFLAWVEDVLVAQYIFALLLRFGSLFPEKIPAVNRFIGKLHQKNISRVGKSYKLFNVPMPPKHRESEYAIPVERTAEALHALRAMIKKYNLKINFVVEVRFVKADSFWLSPTYQRNSCYVGGYLYGDERWLQYFNLFERLMLQYEGRPHWGKEFTPALLDFGRCYEKWNDFQKLRRQCDPQGIFTNNLIDKIFPPHHHEGE